MKTVKWIFAAVALMVLYIVVNYWYPDYKVQSELITKAKTDTLLIKQALQPVPATDIFVGKPSRDGVHRTYSVSTPSEQLLIAICTDAYNDETLTVCKVYKFLEDASTLDK